VNMNTAFWISGRYFRSMRRQRFLPLLSIVSIGGIALGVLALVTVLSIMRGFTHELEKKLMGFNSHITVIKKKESTKVNEEFIRAILSDKVVKDITPFVEGEAIAQSKTLKETSTVGVKVRGVSPKALRTIKGVEFYFPQDSLSFDELEVSKPFPGIIIGSEILADLTVHPDFRDRIELIAPLAEVSPTGELMPVMRSYTLIGAFRCGIYDYDSKTVFVSIREASRLLGQQTVSGFHINLTDSSDSQRITNILRASLGDSWTVENWETQNKKLFAALKLERYAMSAILLLIVLVASFSIVGVIMMIISSKRKDTAILRAMGMNKKFSKSIFLYYGFLIGTIGSVIGGLLGTVICKLLAHYPIRLPTSYYLDTLPVDWSAGSTFFFIICGIVLSILASLYPVGQATTEAPVKVLRYE